MDKNRISDVKKPGGTYEVHHLPRGIQAIHRNYGLWILHTGSNKAPADGFHITPERYFEYFALSHLHKGKGKLWVTPDREYAIVPGQCVIMPPETVHRYGGIDGEPYLEDTVCFTGPVADMLFKTGLLKTGVYGLGTARCLLPIVNQARDPARDSQISANIMLQKLIVDLYHENRKHTSAPQSRAGVVDKLIKTIMDRIYHWWTVEEMAQFCGLSMDQFRRVFKKETGMLPKLYLDKLKLRKAAELLVASDRNVADIAEELSYRDCYHFSRRFKAVMGFSPRQYRQEFGAG